MRKTQSVNLGPPLKHPKHAHNVTISYKHAYHHPHAKKIYKAGKQCHAPLCTLECHTCNSMARRSKVEHLTFRVLLLNSSSPFTTQGIPKQEGWGVWNQRSSVTQTAFPATASLLTAVAQASQHVFDSPLPHSWGDLRNMFSGHRWLLSHCCSRLSTAAASQESLSEWWVVQLGVRDRIWEWLGNKQMNIVLVPHDWGTKSPRGYDH